MTELLDNLIHHPRMSWVPRSLTSWVCDLMDHKLGMTWAEIRCARHGNAQGYTNQLDWGQDTTAAAGGVVVHWNTGERA